MPFSLWCCLFKFSVSRFFFVLCYLIIFPFSLGLFPYDSLIKLFVRFSDIASVSHFHKYLISSLPPRQSLTSPFYSSLSPISLSMSTLLPLATYTSNRYMVSELALTCKSEDPCFPVTSEQRCCNGMLRYLRDSGWLKLMPKEIRRKVCDRKKD